MSPRPAAKPPPVSVAQAAEQFGVDRDTVYSWINRGLLASLAYPGTGARSGPIRIEQAEIDRFKKDCMRPATAGSTP